MGRVALGAALMVGLMSLVLVGSRGCGGLKEPLKSAFFMTMFPNLGNFGLPVCALAFGDEGLAYAVIVMVCGSFLQNSVGVYFAQRSRLDVVRALVKVLCFPMIYAFILAILFQRMGWALPAWLGSGVGITAQAAIPIQLMILGIKIAETSLDRSADVFLAGAMRLCVAPLLAFGVVMLVGLDGLPAKVFVLQMSGPVAVGMAVYGVEFNVKPGFLASAVSWTFLFSGVTVSFVLYLLLRVAL